MLRVLSGKVTAGRESVRHGPASHGETGPPVEQAHGSCDLPECGFRKRDLEDHGAYDGDDDAHQYPGEQDDDGRGFPKGAVFPADEKGQIPVFRSVYLRVCGEGYILDKLEAAASFPYQQTPVCFFGHTHVPLAFVRDTAVRGGTYSRFKIESGKKYLLNVGSVGQSRDGVPKATYVIYDLRSGYIELRRLDYDMETAMKKIIAAGLPEHLASRLTLGH